MYGTLDCVNVYVRLTVALHTSTGILINVNAFVIDLLPVNLPTFGQKKNGKIFLITN